jgi:hypothetical protein
MQIQFQQPLIPFQNSIFYSKINKWGNEFWHIHSVILTGQKKTHPLLLNYLKNLDTYG